MKSLNSSTSRALASLVLVATLVFALVGLPVRVNAQSKTFAKFTPGASTAITVVPTVPVGAGVRSSLTVQNVGSVNVGLGGTSAITYATGIQLAPSQQIVCSGDSDNLFAIAASSTADLRVVATYTQQRVASIPQCVISRLNTTGVTNTAAANTVPMSDGTNTVPGNVIFKMLTSAVTANSTACTDASGSLAITSNATGLGNVFRCDGSNYQLLANYADRASETDSVTVATTSNTDTYVLAPFAGTLIGVDFSGIDTLAANDTNYITFSLTNLGQAGAGTNPMLAATAANTTQVTGGTAITALTKRSLTLNGTGSNLIVAAGDRLRLRFAATGTLANTVTGSKAVLRFTRLS